MKNEKWKMEKESEKAQLSGLILSIKGSDRKQW